jgi:hypothetical protein
MTTPPSNARTVPLRTSTFLLWEMRIPAPSLGFPVPNTWWPFRSSVTPSAPMMMPLLLQGPTLLSSVVLWVMTCPH